MTIGESTKPVKINESVYIPLKEKHALANEGEELMQLIEVQLGDYLGEDDIVRLEDRYGRASTALCHLEFDNLNTLTTAKLGTINLPCP